MNTSREISSVNFSLEYSSFFYNNHTFSIYSSYHTLIPYKKGETNISKKLTDLPADGPSCSLFLVLNPLCTKIICICGNQMKVCGFWPKVSSQACQKGCKQCFTSMPPKDGKRRNTFSGWPWTKIFFHIYMAKLTCTHLQTLITSLCDLKRTCFFFFLQIAELVNFKHKGSALTCVSVRWTEQQKALFQMLDFQKTHPRKEVFTRGIIHPHTLNEKHCIHRYIPLTDCSPNPLQVTVRL